MLLATTLHKHLHMQLTVHGVISSVNISQLKLKHFFFDGVMQLFWGVLLTASRNRE